MTITAENILLGHVDEETAYGTPNSTGHNLRALCGTSVRPTVIDPTGHPVCPKCKRAEEGHRTT